MGSSLVYGVINAMDGERDPRILLSIYEFLPRFLNTFPLGHLIDDMFEVIACYFPIDFNPSATDPKAITRDLLAKKLADCLCAKEEFAENCFNLLIEKLDSQLNVAKLDSLHLLVCTRRTCDTRWPRLIHFIIIFRPYALTSSLRQSLISTLPISGKHSNRNFCPAPVRK